jgi:3'-phosphoadenosine 5'-phosphosulfate sulfotransferase (PAPS reductase)/FAD synthetase
MQTKEYVVPARNATEKFTKDDLKTMQAWPFERKIQVAQTRIMEWYHRHDGLCAVSFSAGKDSTVLLDLARRCFPDIEAVYVNTGLEFPEVRRFAMSTPNVTVLKPEMSFREVVDTYGWCYPSKDVARSIRYAHRGSQWAALRFQGLNADGTPSWFRETRYMRWAYLLDAPFKISDICCEIMKERPLLRYQKETGKKAIVGTLAAESNRRLHAWLHTGCNAFDVKRPVSKPLSFFLEQEILRYLKEFNIPYASVYGDIVQDKKGRLRTTGETRTGCCLCPIGCHLDKVNRFQRLAVTHPKLHDYAINTLGLGKVLDYVGVKYMEER